MPLLICLTFVFIMLGWGIFFTTVLKTDLSIGLFNAGAFASLLMFYSFLLANPVWMAWFVLIFGGIISALTFASLVRVRGNAITIAAYILLFALSFLTAYGLKFSSIDDYSFWGTISKYLFIFNELPTNDHYISASYLTYTPGMASFHYLIYTLAHQYSQLLGYIAQGLILIAAMLVFFDAKEPARSSAYLGIWLILFTLAYGTVFARMQVDAFVAAYVLAIAWLIYKRGHNAYNLIFIPLIFLSVIKEIGMLFAICSLTLLVFVEKPNRKIITRAFVLLAAVLITKVLWTLHTDAYGFHNFSQGASFTNALKALNPFNAYYHIVQLLYLKALFFKNFDMLLKLPYCLWYLLIAGLWVRAARFAPFSPLGRRVGDEGRGYCHGNRINQILGILTLFIFIYILTLYFLQALVFDVGHGNQEILAFQRYYNMLFLPLLGMAIFLTIDTMELSSLCKVHNPGFKAIFIVLLVLLIGGKIERTQRFHNTYDLYALTAAIQTKTAHMTDSNWSMCLINPPDPTYVVNMPLTYFFMPHRLYQKTALEDSSACNIIVKWDNVGGVTIT